jgi:non-homologous end joining protein Ku
MESKRERRLDMTIKWEVDDGYIGKSRPQFVEIDDDELAECDTEEEERVLIDEYVQEDFAQKVSFSWERVE